MARILVVDDEAETRDLFQVALKRMGHQAVTAPDGFSALAEVEAEAPDAILLDIMMPGIDGYETLRRLRALPSGQDIPVIVVTASQESNLGKRVAAAKGNACLMKPVSLTVLEEVIGKSLKRAAAAA
jgi:sigma-B regulation protein RsbU (phosphoserine phosphatase)